MIAFGLEAQEKKEKIISGQVTTRYMQTSNKGELEDFSIMVSWAKVNVDHKFNNWLSFGASGMGLLNYGTVNIEKRDLTTGSGPIYEGNLWNQRVMDGTSEFSLPEFHLDFTFGDHFFSIGRFVQNTPVLNAEVWPFPNAMEGLWYKYQPALGVHLEFGLIDRIAPRFSGQFVDVGQSIGVGGVGVGTDGLPSRYRNNTSSNYMAILNGAITIEKGVSFEVWNYMAENVNNTLVIESKFDLNEAKDLKLAVQFIRQDRLGDGGNADPALRYFADANANELGFSLSKTMNKNEFTLNFTRIGDQGRLLLPRDWGVEPFYTFQRRNRIEGMRDATKLMFKWQSTFSRDNYDFKVYSSLAQSWNQSPTQPEDNKYLAPSTLNWDASIKYVPKQKLKGFTAELFMAYRFLTDKDNDLPIYTINRANFLHSDLIVSYLF
jgi:hypothetical protein